MKLDMLINSIVTLLITLVIHEFLEGSKIKEKIVILHPCIPFWGGYGGFGKFAGAGVGYGGGLGGLGGLGGFGR
uniref:Uncharacterized protein n=1 Tax=Tetranychus urticae TaxID=32264 RepID=T1L133_TETUR